MYLFIQFDWIFWLFNDCFISA